MGFWNLCFDGISKFEFQTEFGFNLESDHLKKKYIISEKSGNFVIQWIK